MISASFGNLPSYLPVMTVPAQLHGPAQLTARGDRGGGARGTRGSGQSGSSLNMVGCTVTLIRTSQG
jgi:hypothetical protein